MNKNIPVKELFQHKQSLSYYAIKSWLKTFNNDFQEALKNTVCEKWQYSLSSNEKSFPCVCQRQKDDCLFIEIYKILQSIKDLKENEKSYLLLLSDLVSIKNENKMFEVLKNALVFNFTYDWDESNNIIIKFKSDDNRLQNHLILDTKEFNISFFCYKLSVFIKIIDAESKELAEGIENIKIKKEKLDNISYPTIQERIIFRKELMRLTSLKLCTPIKKKYLFDFIIENRNAKEFDVYYDCYKIHENKI
nr:hypothetical protein [uncultured Chryseobacterium sp.]